MFRAQALLSASKTSRNLITSKTRFILTIIYNRNSGITYITGSSISCLMPLGKLPTIRSHIEF